MYKYAKLQASLITSWIVRRSEWLSQVTNHLVRTSQIVPFTACSPRRATLTRLLKSEKMRRYTWSWLVGGGNAVSSWWPPDDTAPISVPVELKSGDQIVSIAVFSSLDICGVNRLQSPYKRTGGY